MVSEVTLYTVASGLPVHVTALIYLFCCVSKWFWCQPLLLEEEAWRALGD